MFQHHPWSLMTSHQWVWQGWAVGSSLGTAGWERPHPGHCCLDAAGWFCPPVLPSRTSWDPALQQLPTCLLLQGKPQPEVIWTKGGQPLDTSRINIRNTDKDTIFYIRQSQRSDSGKYELTVRINGAEDKATLDIQVIGKAGDGALQGLSGTCFYLLNGGRSCSGWDGTAPVTRQGTFVSLFQWDLLQDHGGDILWLGMQGSCQTMPHRSFSSHVCCKRVKTD